MKKQIIVIHGGDTFETYEEYISFLKSIKVDISDLKKVGWKRLLEKRLGEDFEVLALRMPSSFNAKYLEWKIWFEKFVPFFQGEVVLVGHSLGGIFLAKYLSENTFPKKIRATFLVAAPFDAHNSEFTLADFILPSSLKSFEKQGGVIHIYQSKDDDVVPFIELEKYQRALPTAQPIVLENYGHFGGDDFPELVEDIKQVYS